MFHVFPEPQSAPLVVPANTDSLPQKLPVLVGGPPENRTMFIAIVKLGAPCALPAGGDPRVILSAGGGAEVEAKPVPDSVSDSSEAFVADVQLKNLGAGVYQVQLLSIDSQHEATEWQLKFRNTEAADQSFVWVVADNDREMRQPWISLPQSLTFTALSGRIAAQTVKVANRGTGTLRFHDTAGLQLQNGFSVTGVPSPIPPNSCGDLEISFTGQPTGGPSPLTRYTADTDDPGVPGTPEHNSAIALTATTTVPLPETITVGVVIVIPELRDEYRGEFGDGQIVAALATLFDRPQVVETIDFPGDGAVPVDPAALRELGMRLVGLFGPGGYPVVTYITQRDDPIAGPIPVRDQRREALKQALGTPAAGITSPITGTSQEISSDAYQIAQVKGHIVQRAFMVVDMVLPPVVTDLAPRPARVGSGFTVRGRDLAFGNVMPEILYSVKSGGSPGSGECMIAPPPASTPFELNAQLPRDVGECVLSLVVRRSDGAEAKIGDLQLVAG
jgi:hypothetical protein